MRMETTAMGAALARAGLVPIEAEFRADFSRFVARWQSRGVPLARMLSIMREEMPDEGQSSFVASDQIGSANVRPQNGDANGRGTPAADGQRAVAAASPDSAG